MLKEMKFEFVVACAFLGVATLIYGLIALWLDGPGDIIFKSVLTSVISICAMQFIDDDFEEEF